MKIHFIKQRTIKNDIFISGIGVHTGLNVSIVLKSAPVDYGIRFFRVDLLPFVQIKVKDLNLSNNTFCTSLFCNNLFILTIEHLLAVIYSFGIDNLIIEINSTEMPILNGRSIDFFNFIKNSGVVYQNKKKLFLKIKQEILVNHGNKWFKVKKFNGFKIFLKFYFDNFIFKNFFKYISFDFSNINYLKSIFKSRTFGFLSKNKFLNKNNLCLGSSIYNSLIINNFNILNKKNYFLKNEFFKHKLIDLLGDLCVIGNNLICCISGYGAGHGLNKILVKTILSNKSKIEVINIKENDFFDFFINY